MKLYMPGICFKIFGEWEKVGVYFYFLNGSLNQNKIGHELMIAKVE